MQAQDRQSEIIEAREEAHPIVQVGEQDFEAADLLDEAGEEKERRPGGDHGPDAEAPRIELGARGPWGRHGPGREEEVSGEESGQEAGAQDEGRRQQESRVSRGSPVPSVPERVHAGQDAHRWQCVGEQPDPAQDDRGLEEVEPPSHQAQEPREGNESEQQEDEQLGPPLPAVARNPGSQDEQGEPDAGTHPQPEARGDVRRGFRGQACSERWRVAP